MVVRDHVLGRPISLELDKLVLASAILPNDVSEALSEVFKTPLDAEGFFLEAHMKLRPVDFASEGLYLAGMAHYPKPIDESIAQANAAVGRALTVLVPQRDPRGRGGGHRGPGQMRGLFDLRTHLPLRGAQDKGRGRLH